MSDIIRTEGLGRCFQSGGEEFWALRNVDIAVPEGKLTILKGRSGSGKTTLLNILGALDKPSCGKVFFDGQEIGDLEEAGRARIRRNQIGFVFQSVALVPMMTALENVDYALRMVKYREGRRERAMECLRLVGLSQRFDHLPQEMSGGEQQRVAIARAIAHRPRVLLADEPTAELDTNTGLQVVKIFQELCKQEHVTVIMTTHDTGLMEVGDCVYELKDGEVVTNG